MSKKIKKSKYKIEKAEFDTTANVVNAGYYTANVIISKESKSNLIFDDTYSGINDDAFLVVDNTISTESLIPEYIETYTAILYHPPIIKENAHKTTLERIKAGLPIHHQNESIGKRTA